MIVDIVKLAKALAILAVMPARLAPVSGAGFEISWPILRADASSFAQCRAMVFRRFA